MNLYELFYFLNRLFIAATRSKKNIIIIDSNESIEENWNSKLWGAGNQTILGLDDFFEQIETKPTLTKANQYFEIGNFNTSRNWNSAEEFMEFTELLVKSTCITHSGSGQAWGWYSWETCSSGPSLKDF